MRKVISKSYHYIQNLLLNENSDKVKARASSVQLGLEAISLSMVEAKIVQFMIELVKPKKIVEIGTLTGLSALYMLENLDADAFLWTIEKSEQHAAMASENLIDYINKNQCKILLGDAKEKLIELCPDGPFDVIFIDGNKSAYLAYFNWALENIKVGGLIIADNVFLAGAVWGDQTLQKFNDKQIKNVNEMNKLAFNNNKLRSIVVPTEEGLLVCKKLF